MFSRRTAWNRELNPVARRLESLRAAGAPLIDLTESNPARAGLHPSADEVARALGDLRAVDYAPEPRGLLSAREAVAAFVSRTGSSISADRLLLTASTSEAYAWLFKLLCEPGDNVLVPQPSYPLFEFLTGLEGVHTRPYPLHFDGQWHLWPDDLRAAADERTRAVLVVNPGNPTGAFLKRDELDGISALCLERQWALVSDEVFADFFDVLPANAVRRAATGDARCLTFSLSGLSKAAALPGLKLGWMLVDGPAAERDEALARLELIADTYLSVNTPVQLAAGSLLALVPEVQARILARLRTNRAHLAAHHHADASWSLLPSEAGWSAILRIPARETEEEVCLRLLDRGVSVQPGYFFDFAAHRYLVISLLPDEQVFAEGVRRLTDVLDAL